MPTIAWVSLAISAYFFLALVELIDKKILSSPSLKPLAYAFYSGILVSLALVLWPLDFSFLPFGLTVIAFFAGATFFAGIYFLYDAIISGEVSRAVSIIGGISPILIVVFSFLFLGERLSLFSLIAIIMLIGGSFSLAFTRSGRKFEFGRQFFCVCFLAALFFAVSYGLTKLVFLKTSFLNGFIWIRLGTLFCSLAVFLTPSFRKSIFEASTGISRKLTVLFIFNRGISALGHVILNYAVMLGSVAVINALQAVQYSFLFLMTLGFSCFYPKFFCEPLSLKSLIPKIFGILLVSGGIILLFIGGT